jgi:hypothetical protein
MIVLHLLPLPKADCGGTPRNGNFGGNMNDFEQFAAQLDRLVQDTWAGRTLADLRNEAATKMNGTAFSALRTDEGQRFLLVVCVTGEHELRKVLRVFELDPSGKPVNWETEAVVSVIMRTIESGGFGYEEERDVLTGAVTALTLVSAEPASMGILESIFSFPS